MTVEKLIAEEDMLAAHIVIEGTHKGDSMGTAATGKRIRVTVTEMFRIADGKFVERWGNVDEIGLMRQLGVIPTPNE